MIEYVIVGSMIAVICAVLVGIIYWVIAGDKDV